MQEIFLKRKTFQLIALKTKDENKVTKLSKYEHARLDERRRSPDSESTMHIGRQNTFLTYESISSFGNGISCIVCSQSLLLPPRKRCVPEKRPGLAPTLIRRKGEPVTGFTDIKFRCTLKPCDNCKGLKDGTILLKEIEVAKIYEDIKTFIEVFSIL